MCPRTERCPERSEAAHPRESQPIAWRPAQDTHPQQPEGMHGETAHWLSRPHPAATARATLPALGRATLSPREQGRQPAAASVRPFARRAAHSHTSLHAPPCTFSVERQSASAPRCRLRRGAPEVWERAIPTHTPCSHAQRGASESCSWAVCCMGTPETRAPASAWTA